MNDSQASIPDTYIINIGSINYGMFVIRTMNQILRLTRRKVFLFSKRCVIIVNQRLSDRSMGQRSARLHRNLQILKIKNRNAVNRHAYYSDRQICSLSYEQMIGAIVKDLD